MSSVTLTGKLKDPGGFFAIGDKIRFTHESSTGLVVKSSELIITIPTSGSYIVELQYGNVKIDYKDKNKETFKTIGAVTVNQETTATTIPELLLSAVPPTNEQVLEFQELLQESKEQVELAEAEANNAAQSATAAAQSEANAEQSALESAQSAIDAGQAQEALPEPDVFLPFNNKIVDSLGGELTFSRASATTNVNKSGFVETLGVDEPAITKDGISSYDEYTNSAIYSEDFSQWNDLIQGSANIEYGGHSSPDSGSGATKLTVTSGTAGFFLSGAHSTLNSNASVWARGEVGGEKLSFGFGDARQDFTLTDKWQRYDYTGDGSGSDAFTIYHYDASDTTVYLWGAQSTETDFLAPYIKTESVPVTRSPDLISIDVMNNLPVKGSQYTIVCDVDIPDTTNASAWAVNAFGGNFDLVRYTSGNSVWVGTTGIVFGYDKTLGLKRYAISFDESSNTSKGYIDGVLIDTGTTTTKDINYQADIIIGRLGPTSRPLNSEVSNFRIYHKALTDAQIAKLGSAQ